MFCPECRIKLADNAKFCPKCGTKIQNRTGGAAPTLLPPSPSSVSSPSASAPQAHGPQRESNTALEAKNQRGGMPKALLAAIPVLIVVVILAVWLVLKMFSSPEAENSGGIGAEESESVEPSGEVNAVEYFLI